MRQMDILRKYLKRKEDVDIAEQKYPFVTISRQAGAGGHALGREIIKRLDDLHDMGWNREWDLFDQKLCAMIAQDADAPALFDSLVQEEYREGLHQTVYEMFMGQAEHYKLQKRIMEVVRLLARIGKVVIIGRGGAWITRELAMGLHVRLMAPEVQRILNVMHFEHMERDAATRMVRKQDRDRRKLVADFYNQEIDDPLQYDLVCNTDRMDMYEIADMVVGLVRHRVKNHKTAAAAPLSF